MIVREYMGQSRGKKRNEKYLGKTHPTCPGLTHPREDTVLPQIGVIMVRCEPGIQRSRETFGSKK